VPIVDAGFEARSLLRHSENTGRTPPVTARQDDLKTPTAARFLRNPALPLDKADGTSR
jgi:hypothetical protein